MNLNEIFVDNFPRQLSRLNVQHKKSNTELALDLGKIPLSTSNEKYFFSFENKIIPTCYTSEEEKNLELVANLILFNKTSLPLYRDLENKLILPVNRMNTILQGYNNIFLFRNKTNNTFKIITAEEVTKKSSLNQFNYNNSDYIIVCCPGGSGYKKILLKSFKVQFIDSDWFFCTTPVLIAIITKMVEKRISSEILLKWKLSNI